MATSEQEHNHTVTSDIIQESEDIKSCEPCMRKHTLSIATVVCKTCKELLCDSCTHNHIIYKPEKHNTVVLSDSAAAPVVVNMKGMDKCIEHGKKIMFFCEDHYKLCCNTCAFKHRKCDNVSELATLAGQEGLELHDLKNTLVNLFAEIGNIIADCKRSEEDLYQTIANLPKQVEEVNDRIMQMFDKATPQMMAELDNFKAEEMNRLDETDKASSKVNECIHEIIPVSSTLVEHGTFQQKYIITKMIKDKITDIENRLTEQQNKDITSTVSLVFTEKLSSLLAYKEDIVKLNTERHRTHIDVATISPANVQESSDINKGNPDSNKGSSRAIALPAPIKPLTLELIASVDLKPTGYDKKEPVITGLDIFPDGRLIAVDNINWKCTVLNDRLQKQGTSYTFNKYPFEVVCLSQRDIAVTMCEKSVCLLTVSSENNIYLIIEIQMSSNVFSICCMTPQTMVVSTYEDSRPVRMLSLENVEADFFHAMVDGIETDFDPAVVPKTYKLGKVRSRTLSLITLWY